MKPRRRSRAGQTLVEVIIATSVVGLVMTAVVAVVTISLRNVSRAKAKALGTKYTQEGVEYFRTQKNVMGWETFYQTIQEGGSLPTYCMADLPYSQNGGLEQLPNRACISTEYVDPQGIYKRHAQVTTTFVNGTPTVNVIVVTSWPDADHMTQSSATAQFQPSQN